MGPYVAGTACDAAQQAAFASGLTANGLPTGSTLSSPSDIGSAMFGSAASVDPVTGAAIAATPISVYGWLVIGLGAVMAYKAIKG
jgi:hypothetical protein